MKWRRAGHVSNEVNEISAEALPFSDNTFRAVAVTLVCSTGKINIDF